MPSKITLALVAVAAYRTAQVVAAPFQQPYDLVERDYAEMETLEARIFDDQFNEFYARQTGGAELSPISARGWLSAIASKLSSPKPPPAAVYHDHHIGGAPHPPHPHPYADQLHPGHPHHDSHGDSHLYHDHLRHEAGLGGSSGHHLDQHHHDLTHHQHHEGGGFQGDHQHSYSHPNQQHHDPYAQQRYDPNIRHHQDPHGHPHYGNAYRRELAAAAKPVTDAFSESGEVVDEPQSDRLAEINHHKHHFHRLTQGDIAKLSPEERHAYKMRARKHHAAAQRKKELHRKQINAAEPKVPKDATAALSRRSRANY